MSDTTKDVVDAILFRNADPIGVVQVPESEVDNIGQALRNAGLEVKRGEKTGTDEYEFTDECNEENHRPCEIATGLGMIQGYANKAGVDSREIDALKQGKMPTDEDTRRAMDAVIARMNPDSDEGYTAKMLRDTVFGDAS